MNREARAVAIVAALALGILIQQSVALRATPSANPAAGHDPGPPHVDLRFGGSGSYVEVPSSRDFSLGKAGLTVAVWMRPDALTFSKTEGSLASEQYVHWLGKGER